MAGESADNNSAPDDLPSESEIVSLLVRYADGRHKRSIEDFVKRLKSEDRLRKHGLPLRVPAKKPPVESVPDSGGSFAEKTEKPNESAEKTRVESRESLDDEQSRGLIFPEEEGESKVMMKRSKGGDCKLKVGPETLTDRKEEASENSAERSSADGVTSTTVGESKR